jgi:hypothetical protein
VRVDARDLARLRNVTTRSISPENVNGAKGGGGRAAEGTGANAARDLGVGWKISPSMSIEPGDTFPLATIDGPGTITHVWLTTANSNWRTLVFRAYWDDAAEPAVEVPLGDFLCQRMGPVRSGQLEHDRGQPARRLQLLLADALPAPRPADGGEPR